MPRPPLSVHILDKDAFAGLLRSAANTFPRSSVRAFSVAIGVTQVCLWHWMHDVLPRHRMHMHTYRAVRRWFINAEAPLRDAWLSFESRGVALPVNVTIEQVADDAHVFPQRRKEAA